MRGLLCLTFAVVLAPAASGKGTDVAVVSTIVKDTKDLPDTTTVKVTVRNLSAKIVTAFECRVDAHYRDGSVRHGYSGIDEATYLSYASPALTFRPGSTRTLAVTLLSAELPTSVSAQVTAIAFDDGTAVGDPVWIRRWESQRREEADRIRIASTVMYDLRTSVDPLAALKAAAARGRRGLPGTPDFGDLVGVLDGFETPPGSVDAIIVYNRARHELMLRQSALTHAGSPATSPVPEPAAPRL